MSQVKSEAFDYCVAGCRRFVNVTTIGHSNLKLGLDL